MFGLKQCLQFSLEIPIFAVCCTYFMSVLPASGTCAQVVQPRMIPHLQLLFFIPPPRNNRCDVTPQISGPDWSSLSITSILLA